MIKKVAMVAISAIIGVLLVVTVLTPILMGATSETLTTRNTGSFFAAVSDDDTEHTIIISAGTGSFVIKTDGKTDITPSMGTYNPGGQYTAKAIAIGVYQSSNTDGIALSQAGKSVYTNSSTVLNGHRQAVLNGNKDITAGTYEMMNYYQYVLYKIMATTIMGNTDSTYMMGNKLVSTNTGIATSPYEKYAESGDGSSLLIENGWGYYNTYLGDAYKTADNHLIAGNTLGGKTYTNSTNALNEDIVLPSDNAYYVATIYTDADAWGTPLTVSDTIGTQGESFNDSYYVGDYVCTVIYGGYFPNSINTGLYYLNTKSAFAPNTGNNQATSRLAYIMTDYTPTTTNYGYILELGADGATVESVTLADGTTEIMPTGTTLNDYWQFDTTTGIGPFGCYYVAINLADVDTESDTDYLAETMLSTKKGEIAYILNPSDWTETLAGTTFTANNYNVMMVVPTVYWGVSDGKLYMSNSPDTFSDVEGLEMAAYAHTYTVDPSVDTGNPVTTASATVVYGEDYIVRLYSTGDVYLITTNAMTYLGQASGENTVDLTVTGDILGYTPSGGSATTIDDVLAYIASTGEYVQCKNPMYSTSQEGAQFIIGGYANNLTTTTDDVVDIGYCLTVDAADLSLSTITVLNPVSDASNTVDTNGAVWGESTLIKSDLYKVGDLTITTTWSDTGKSVATYNYYLAPEKVVYKNPNYLDNGPVESILNVLPIIIVAGLLLGIMGMIVVGKLKE